MVGVITEEGSVLKGSSIRKAENCSFREQWGIQAVLLTVIQGNIQKRCISVALVRNALPSKAVGCQPSRSLGWARNHFPKVDSIG